MTDELSNLIEQNAASPKRAKGDAGEVEQHPLKDQIEVDRYLASKNALKNKNMGIKITKMVNPGA